MLLLISITDKLQLVSSAAATLDVVASIQDKTVSTQSITSASQRTAITTAATTDIVAAPAAGIERNIKELSIRNKHASLSCDVTPVLDANGTDYEIVNFALRPGETLEYIEGIGWFKIENAAALDRKLIVPSDVVNATTSFADVTGLTCPVLSGKSYNFIAHLFHLANATTTGAFFAVNGPTMTAFLVNCLDGVTHNVAAAAVASGTQGTKDTNIIVETTSSVTAVMAIISGHIQPSADGTFAIRCASEVAVAAGITVKAGSWCRIWEATG